MEIINIPLWAWIVFYVLVFIMLIIDLKSFGRKGQHEVSVSEALKMTAVWIGVSLVFCAGIYMFYPGGIDVAHEKAMEFLAGYLIEKSLSMDNLFVFLMLFSFFGIERKFQHEVLFWGIFGALVLRSIFIFAILGLRALYFALAAVAKYFTYLKYGLGIILSFVGVKMLLAMNEYVNELGNLVGFDINMPHIEVPTPVSLAIIFGVLVLSMLLSVVIERKRSQDPC